MDDKYVAFLDVLGFTAWANEHDLYDIQDLRYDLFRLFSAL